MQVGQLALDRGGRFGGLLQHPLDHAARRAVAVVRVFDDQHVGAQIVDALLDGFAAGAHHGPDRGAAIREARRTRRVVDEEKAARDGRLFFTRGPPAACGNQPLTIFALS